MQIAGREESSPTVVIGKYTSEGSDMPTIWTEKAFYTAKGTNQIQSIFGSREFPFQKNKITLRFMR